MIRRPKWTVSTSSSLTALGALALIVVVAIAPIQSSVALLANTGVANQNPIHGGALDLKLSERGPATQDSTTDEISADVVSDTWEDRTHNTLGTDNVSNTLEVDNSASTLAANVVNITISYTENDSDANDGNAVNTSRTLEVTAFSYAGNDLTDTELTDQNGNGRLDVDDLTRGSNAENLSTLTGIAAGQTAQVTFAVSGSTGLISGVGSSDGVDITVELRVQTRSFADIDHSTNNTIQYG